MSLMIVMLLLNLDFSDSTNLNNKGILNYRIRNNINIYYLLNIII